MQGVVYMTELVQEAWENGDTVYARELNVVLTQNIDHPRRTFGFLKDIP